MITSEFLPQMVDLVDAAKQLLSDVKPSTWTEQRRFMSSEISPFPGKFSYERTPYLREIVDTVAADHPAHTIAVMKGAQIGFSTGVIEAAIGYIISENPGPILYLAGHEDLAVESMNTKVDQMIDSCGLRALIRPNVMRKKKSRTGDTAKSKEFPGGSLTAGSANNHKLLRQRSVRYGFYDDYEAVKSQSKESGSTERLIDQRHAAYRDKMKKYFISTPERMLNSNINEVYKKGDQRKYHMPCPHCNVYIALEWETELKGTDGVERAGMTWKTDDQGRLIDGQLIGEENSVGYICQECGEFFDESHKKWMLDRGEWIPTAEPSEIGYYSYHLSSLYAPPGMKNWTDYVRQFLEAENATLKKEGLQQTFQNLVLGLPFEPTSETPKANDLQKNNIRSYPIGTVPDVLSVADGNGRILLLTCAADMNGKEEDARLDYEITGWSESGAAYSIQHGSIGTFIPRENQLSVKEDRRKWTYRTNSAYSVWPELTKIISQKYPTQTGKEQRIFMFGLDSRHFTNFAYAYIDKFNNPFRVGLMGREESKVMKFGTDVPIFKAAQERSKLYLVEVNAVKDDLADMMRLKWDHAEAQPPGFLNYPTPSDGLYGYNNYFTHYEAEQRITELKDGAGIGYRWVKKRSNLQNHMWDCRVYNIALRDIFVNLVLSANKTKIKNPQWVDYVAAVRGGM
jgi:phage terminase large subunit GpA-like protein